MIRNKLQEQLKQAMHARDELACATLRLIIAAMKDRDIAARGKGNWDGIADVEILSMLQSMIKQRHESIKMYEIGKRPELAEREMAEIKIIEGFLPTQLSEEDVHEIIDGILQEVGATGIKDMGKVMAVMKDKYAGQIDFSKASGWVKEKLSA